MDKSETYIKMCEGAEEIQKQSPCKAGYANNSILWNSADKVILSAHKKGSFMVDSKYNIFVEGWWAGNSRHIWLPRQDQLQDMLGFRLSASYLCLVSFIDYYMTEVNEECDFPSDWDSWEQLWLALVMKEKYNKVWTNNEWRNGSE